MQGSGLLPQPAGKLQFNSQTDLEIPQNGGPLFDSYLVAPAPTSLLPLPQNAVPMTAYDQGAGLLSFPQPIQSMYLQQGQSHFMAPTLATQPTHLLPQPDFQPPSQPPLFPTPTHIPAPQIFQPPTQPSCPEPREAPPPEPPADFVPPPPPPFPKDSDDKGKEEEGMKKRGKWCRRTIDCYEDMEMIGKGVYGHVYRAREKGNDKEYFALKKIGMTAIQDGFDITTLREIKLLKKLRHPNVIDLRDIVTDTSGGWGMCTMAELGHLIEKGGQAVYMIFEYMDHDLAGLMKGRVDFTENQVCHYMKQLVAALAYCHANHVFHRDLKGSNVLLNARGDVKLADFGLARTYADDRRGYTNRVITLWYRPPELLMGEEKYGPEVDMWSAGCMLGELLAGTPMFKGQDEISQLDLICRVCGTPDESTWQGVETLPWYSKICPRAKYTAQLHTFMSQYGTFSQEALLLLEAMLAMDPSKRMLADVAAQHVFFNRTYSMDEIRLPTDRNYHEYGTRLEQQRKQTHT